VLPTYAVRTALFPLPLNALIRRVGGGLTRYSRLDEDNFRDGAALYYDHVTCIQGLKKI
jgi:hypothetical protein